MMGADWVALFKGRQIKSYQKIMLSNRNKTRNLSGDEIAKRDLMIFSLLIYSPAL